MNDKFHQAAKSIAQSVTSMILCLVLAAQCTVSAWADDFKRGPLLDLSDPDTLADCERVNPVGGIPGGNQQEVYIAVNPINRKNVIAVWIGGLFLGIGCAVSMDGGKSWQQVEIQGLTLCTGGSSDLSFDVASDPWLSFALNGDLYLINGDARRPPEFGGTLSPRKAIVVSKSVDGGLHWSGPLLLADATDTRFYPDKPTITADPANPRLVYAIWDGVDNGQRGPALFSRTTDGGATWEAARAIVQTDSHDYVETSQVFVLPDSTLIDLYALYHSVNSGGGGRFEEMILATRSKDKGLSWSAPILVANMLPLLIADYVLTTDPDTGNLVQDVGNPAFAIDPRNGTLYAVWEDARFSNFQYNSIAFSMSTNGGLTWSPPIQVNKTPGNITLANRQAFFPSVAVAADGTIGVAYYDFRNNTSQPGALTDYWLVYCQPSSTTPATNSVNWNNEVRLTDSSFDIEAAINLGHGYWIGDYQSLTSAGNDFLVTWNQPYGNDLDSVFFRRVGR